MANPGGPGPDVIKGDSTSETLNGEGGGDVLFGEGGNDTLNGGSGSDELDGGLGDDTLNGGSGFDAASYLTLGAGPGPGVSVTLGIGKVDPAQMEGDATGGAGIDKLFSIEAVHGSDKNDVLVVTGRLSEEIYLRGNGGNDMLQGPDARDAGVWASYFESTTRVVARIDAGAAGQRFTVEERDPTNGTLKSTDTLVNIWALAGSAFDDEFTGGNGNERFNGREGNDIINGGGTFDSDFAEYNETQTHIVVNLAGGFAFDGFGTKDTLANIENIRATSFDDDITGHDGANILLGRGGSDTLRGLGGNDVLVGDDGNDIFDGGSGSDSVDGGAGNDRLDGGLGLDFLIGGSGNDTYIVDSTRESIVEAAGRGTDTVLASASHILSAGADIEVLRLLKPSAKTKIALQGNGFDNAITGGSGVNSIKGHGGNDAIDAAGGKDSVNGGIGNDRIDGGRGQDTLTGGKGRDVFEFGKGETGTRAKTADSITDFSGRQRDKIDLKAIDANVKAKGNQAFKFIGDDDFTKAGQVRYEKVGKVTYLSYNTDADSAAEGVIKVKGAMDFQKGWFVL
jgi:Ca2+-binding RTX toxin-like protein